MQSKPGQPGIVGQLFFCGLPATGQLIRSQMAFSAELVDITAMNGHCAEHAAGPLSAMSRSPICLRGTGCSGLLLQVRGCREGALAPVLCLVPITFCSGLWLLPWARAAVALL